MSTSGVFFTFDAPPERPPEPGKRIQFGVVLEHADPHGPVEVRCTGTVMRVETVAEAVGVAVSVDDFDLVTRLRPSGL